MSTRRSDILFLIVLFLTAVARPGAAQTAPVYNPANGHWYQAVLVPGGISWPQARDAAAALSYAGYPGHLVTITSMDENGFVDSYLPLPGADEWWTGAYQDRSAPDYSEPAGGWRWLTGEPWSYTFWGAGQPDNFQGDQDNMDIDTRFGDHWDDRYEADRVGGYIVEYEPQPVAPPVSPPNSATQLVLFPNPVLGGQPALGQVTLAQPAGVGGEVLSLTSSNPAAAAVPASATVPPGATSASFVITTLPVAVPTPVVITAACAFGPATATLQVLPLPTPPPAPAGVNLLVNGSFEEPRVPAGQPNLTLRGVNDLPGWLLLGGTVDVVPDLPAGWPPAPDGGRQSLDLVGNPGAGTIEQAFPTQPGSTYLFSGWISHAWGIPEGRATVLLNRQPFVQLYHSNALYGTVTPTDLRWQPFFYPFRAAGPTTTLTITDVTGLSQVGGMVLDGLSVTLAPDQNPPVATAGAPAAPTGLMVRATSANQVTLAWTDNSPSETAVAVWRKGGGADWVRVGALPAHTTSFTDSGLAPGTSYTYRVRVIGGNVASDWSNEVTVTTPAGV